MEESTIEDINPENTSASEAHVEQTLKYTMEIKELFSSPDSESKTVTDAVLIDSINESSEVKQSIIERDVTASTISIPDDSQSTQAMNDVNHGQLDKPASAEHKQSDDDSATVEGKHSKVSKNPVWHSSHNTAGRQLKLSELSSTDEIIDLTNKTVLQSTHIPSYILVKRKSLSAQDASKKPGGKLTSLLQRLTAARSSAVKVEQLVPKTSETSDKLSITAVNTENVVNSSRLPEAYSASSNCAEPVHAGQVVSHCSIKEPLSGTTENPPVSSAQPLQDSLQHKPTLIFKLSPQIDSRKHQEKITDNSTQSQTPQSLLLKTDVLPIKTKSSDDIQQSVTDVHSNKSKKSPKALAKTAPQIVKVCQVGGESERCLTSAETASFVSLGQPALFSAVKRKYVLGYVSLKDSSITQVREPKEHNILVGDTHKLETEPCSVQKTTPKSHYQFSLLQNKLLKHPTSVAMSTNSKDTIKTPYIYNLLSKPSASSLIKCKLSSHPLSGATSVAPSSYISSALMSDLRKLSTVPGLKSNQLTAVPQCSASQLIFQPISCAVVTSGSSLSPGTATLALSKLSAMPAASKESKAGIAASNSNTTLESPPATVLAKSTKANLKKRVPASITTKSDTTKASRYTKTKKTVNSLAESSQLNTNIQPLTNTKQSYSKLITNIAKQYLPGTFTNTHSREIPFRFEHPLDVAIKSQTMQGIPKQEAATTSIRVIVSGDSALNTATKYVPLQAETCVTPTDEWSTNSTTDMTTLYNISNVPVAGKRRRTSVTSTMTPTCATTLTSVTSTTAQTSAKMSDRDKNSKCKPVAICPKPVKVTISHPGTIPSVKLLPQTLKLVLPSTLKAVSLLNSSSAPKIKYMMPTSEGNSTAAISTTKTYPKKSHKLKTIKSAHYKLIVKNNVTEESATNVEQNPSLETVSDQEVCAKDHQLSAEKAIYSSTFETGQRLVSVLRVNPDGKDDSTDTISNTGICSLEFPEVSQLTSADVTGLTACTNGNSLHEHADLKYPVKSETIVQDIQDSSSYTDDEVSNKVPEQTMYRTASLDDDDSDLDIKHAEEQDMSVLQQLLMGKGPTGQPDNYPVTSMQFQMNKYHQIKSNIDNSHLSCSDTSENKLSNSSISDQHLMLTSTASPQIVPGFLDQVNQDQLDETDYCGFKIESIFSLSGNGDFECDDSHPDRNADTQVLPLSNELSPVFNIRTSDDWKNFVTPCFVVLERLSKSEILAKRSDEIPSKCSGHCRKRTLEYLCNLNLLICVNHPDTMLFLKPNRKFMKPNRKLSTKRIQRNKTKHKVSKRICVSKTVYEPQHDSNMIASLKQELLCELTEKSLNSTIVPENTTQSSVVSKTDLQEIEQSFSSAQDNQKTNYESPYRLDITSSSLNLKTFHSGLKQLQKQVNRKREKMSNQKLSRKTKRKSPMKNKRNIKSKSQTEPLTKKRRVSTIKKRRTVKTKKHVKHRTIIPTNGSHAFDLSTSHSDGLCHISSKLNMDSNVFRPYVSKFNMNNSGTSLQSHCSTNQSLKVPIPKLKTGANIVSIRPKMQTLPAGKVKAALQSLNSYLASTGRKPTLGNTQYILLKIDDQHVLVKLPFSSTSTAQLNNVSLSNTVPGTHVNKTSTEEVKQYVQQKTQSDSNINIAATNTQTVSSNTNTFTAAKAVSIINTSASAVSNTNTFTAAKAVSIINTSASAVSNTNTSTAAKAISIINTTASAVSNINTSTAAKAISIINTTASAVSNTNTSTAAKAVSVINISKSPNTVSNTNTHTAAKAVSIINISTTANTVFNTNKSTAVKAVSIINANTVSNTNTHTAANTLSRISTSFTTPNIIFVKTPPGIAKSISCTSSFVSGTTKTVSNTLASSVIAQTAHSTAKTSLRITKSTATKSTEQIAKTSAVSQFEFHPNLRNALTVNRPTVYATSTITGVTGKQPVTISLLKPGVTSQVQPIYSLMTPVYRMRSVNDTATLSIVSDNRVSPLGMSSTSIRAGGGCSDSILSRLPPNSMLLPERKRMTNMSEEARAIKRCKLEAKYPLPPGIIIKAEPDDPEYEISTGWSSVSQASLSSNIPVAHQAHTLIRESTVSSSHDQQSFQTHDSVIDVDALDLPVSSASDLEEVIESCEIIQGSPDSPDEPPALINETTSDGTEQNIPEDIADKQEDMPPILQPMFTSSYSSLVEDTEIIERDDAVFTPGKSTEDYIQATASLSNTSMHSEDSGIDTNIPSTSNSFTSVQNLTAASVVKSSSKNLKIQHLKELLKKKEMEIESMKKMRFEFPSLDLDQI